MEGTERGERKRGRGGGKTKSTRKRSGYEKKKDEPEGIFAQWAKRRRERIKTTRRRKPHYKDTVISILTLW